MAARSGKQAYRAGEKPAWPAWIWLCLGAALGVACSALVLVKDWVPILRKNNGPQPNAAAVAPGIGDPAVADDAGKPTAPPKKTYDFYTVLPEMEVVIPDAELSAKAKAEQQRQTSAAAQAPAQPPTAPTAAESNGRYVLLAGSYGDPHAADEAKAKLALLGIVARVQPITINGKTWNRVMVGPYANASETETAKQTLADNGVKAIPMKLAASP